MTMNKKEIMKHLETIYIDYFDGLYNESQLKFMLLNLYKKVDINISEWSEMLLEVQWKHATEEDYEKKRQQLAEFDTED